MAMKPYQVWIPIPKGYSSTEEKVAIAQEIIDYIQARSKAGRDKNESQMPGYSASYKGSLDFKNAGKSGKVNLTLSGDMLAALKILDVQSGRVKIGYDDSDPEAGRAEGNILGTYGQDSPIRGKKRDFLGIKPSILQREVLSKYPLRDRTESKERAQTVLESGDQASEFFNELFNEDSNG